MTRDTIYRLKLLQSAFDLRTHLTVGCSCVRRDLCATRSGFEPRELSILFLGEILCASSLAEGRGGNFGSNSVVVAGTGW